MHKKLTAEQRAAFHAKVQAYGIKPADVVDTIETGATPGPTRLSSRSNTSDHPVAGWITAANIRELKQKLGVKDEDIDAGQASDQHVRYPSAPSPWLNTLTRSASSGCDVKEGLKTGDSAERQRVLAAQLAYVHGHSQKVTAYESAINLASFPEPMSVPVFAAENVIVTAGHPLVLASEAGKPMVVAYGSVTVEKGAQIEVIGGSIQWSSQSFVQE